MTPALLSPRAQRDIDRIWDHTAVIWGVDQAELYIRQIEAAIRLIAGNPQLGKACDDIRRSYRKYPAGSHLLFYRLVSTHVEIIRILHQRMDFERHL